MRTALRTLSLGLPLALAAILVSCSTDSPSNPLRGSSLVVPGRTTNLPTVVTTAQKFDLNADGSDSTVVTANAKDADGRALPNAQIIWSVRSIGYTGSVGNLSSTVSITDGAGNASTRYRAPNLEFVPTGAVVVVTATLNVENNPQGSPQSSVNFILRPKGSGPSGATGPAAIPAPFIDTVTPDAIRVDTTPPVTVILQGENFSASAEVLIVTGDGLFQGINVQVLSATQIRFNVGSTLRPGTATLFVTGPDNTLSNGVSVTLTSGTTSLIVPVITQILPAQGPVGKATQVVLLGENFDVGNCPRQSNVTFINEFIGLQKVCPAPNEKATSTRLVVNTPIVQTSQAGAASVFVTNDDGAISNSVTFTFTSANANAPVITALAPNEGPTTGETKVVISGSNFSASDQVVITAPGIFSPAADRCSDGQPTCSGNQCILSASRGTCTINGTSNVNMFKFIGSGQIEIITPNVGTTGSGPADVFIQTPAGVVSNIATFTFKPPGTFQAPTITAILPSAIAGFGCCTQGTYQLIILGSNFRKCSSVIFVGDRLYEILPSVDIDDCNTARGSGPTPSQRLQQILGVNQVPDCQSRPDLVPLTRCDVVPPAVEEIPGVIPPHPCAPYGATSTRYVHGSICRGIERTNFALGLVAQILGPGKDVTSGGAYSWINEGEIRVFFGPNQLPPCGETSDVSVFVSNDPGRGLSGDQISNQVIVSFENTQACP